MATPQESFRDELTNLAKAVEILENSDLFKENIEILSELTEKDFNALMGLLNNRSEDEKCVISIGSVNFTFLKK